MAILGLGLCWLSCAADSGQDSCEEATDVLNACSGETGPIDPAQCDQQTLDWANSQNCESPSDKADNGRMMQCTRILGDGNRTSEPGPITVNANGDWLAAIQGTILLNGYWQERNTTFYASQLPGGGALFLDPDSDREWLLLVANLIYKNGEPGEAIRVFKTEWGSAGQAGGLAMNESTGEIRAVMGGNVYRHTQGKPFDEWDMIMESECPKTWRKYQGYTVNKYTGGRAWESGGIAFNDATGDWMHVACGKVYTNGEVVFDLDRLNSTYREYLNPIYTALGGIAVNSNGDWAAILDGMVIINGNKVKQRNTAGEVGNPCYLSGDIVLEDNGDWKAVTCGSIKGGNLADEEGGYRIFNPPETTLNSGGLAQSSSDPDEYLFNSGGSIFRCRD